MFNYKKEKNILTAIKNDKYIINENYLLNNNKRLYIFDLDDTLYLRTLRGLINNYDNYCDIDIDKLHEYIKEIIYKLHESNKILCIASHNPCVKYCLNKLGILHLFTYIIGEKRNKKSMVLEILNHTQIAYDEAIFLDDLIDNIKDVSELGLESHFLGSNLGILELI